MFDPSLFSSPVNILVSYNEVLRDPNTFIQKLITQRKSLRYQLEKYIDVTRFDNQSDSHNHLAMTLRSEKNLLKWLAIKEFNYESNYEKLYDKYPHMFEDSEPLEMYRALSQTLDKSFVNKLYVYNKVLDKRQMYDLYKTFGKTDKLVYVNGDYLDVIDRLGTIEVIIDNDIDRISPLFSYPSCSKTMFMIARYGYNYTVNPVLENSLELKDGLTRLSVRRKINLVEFSPIKVTKEALRNG